MLGSNPIFHPYHFGFEDVGHPDIAFRFVSKIQVVERKTDPKIGTRDPSNDCTLKAPRESWGVCIPCLVPVLSQNQHRSETVKLMYAELHQLMQVANATTEIYDKVRGTWFTVSNVKNIWSQRGCWRIVRCHGGGMEGGLSSGILEGMEVEREGRGGEGWKSERCQRKDIMYHN